jgi:hypothetical protein
MIPVTFMRCHITCPSYNVRFLNDTHTAPTNEDTVGCSSVPLPSHSWEQLYQKLKTTKSSQKMKDGKLSQNAKDGQIVSENERRQNHLRKENMPKLSQKAKGG